MTSEGPHETIIPLVEEGKDSKTIPSSSNDDFALAHSESLGFFPDIAENDWRRIKAKTRSMQPERVAKAGKIEMGCWFQNHFEPDFAWRHERRIGKRGDGGKWTCDPHLIQEQKRCLVYSIGSNGDPTFEQAVLEEIGSHCEVHTFDFDNFTDIVQGAGSTYHQWGLSNETGTVPHPKRRGETAQMKTLADTVKLLGHEGRVIDLFKIDCEGCEWTTVSSWFEADRTLRQVLIELHSTIPGGDVLLPQTPNFFRTMYDNGYVVTHKEPNIMFWDPPNKIKALEYVFLKLHPSFFLDESTGKSWLKKY